jgi:hypothetical protein
VIACAHDLGYQLPPVRAGLEGERDWHHVMVVQRRDRAAA